MAESREQVLVASVHDVRHLATMLRALSFESRATFAISEAGLIVSVEQARVLLARAYIPLSLFDEYAYTAEHQSPSEAQEPELERDANTAFEIPLDILIECLNIFGTATSNFSQGSFDNRKKKKWKHNSEDEDEGGDRGRGKRGGPPRGHTTIDQFFPSAGERKTGMRMIYAGTGHPLTLILAEDTAGPTTTCEIQTMENESLVDLPFDDTQKVIKIILRSSWLRDALSELDPSCDKLTFIGTPPSEALTAASGGAQKSAIKPTFRLSAEGTFGSTQMDYPNDRDVLETFECAERVQFAYRVRHITCALRALQSSLKTSLRIDDEGLLSLQFMMTGGPGAFVEFRCLPLQDDL